MNKCQCRKSVVITLITICIIQLAVSIFWGSKKNFLFFDEVFSYPAANNFYEADSEFAENTWMDGSWFENYMSADAAHRFDYSIPYENQTNDVHPPLFYFFLHTVCSIIPERFSYWAGISVNIAFFLGCTIVLYFIGKEVFGSRVCALAAAFLYAVSYGGINTMVYIRMYMLLTLMTLLHALVYLKYFEEEAIKPKSYIFLALTLVGGVLSQYYFLFIAFFFGAWYTIKFVAEKHYKVLVKYISTILISAGVSLAVWPSMLEHLFGGGRGEEARGNLLSLDGYFSDLKEMFRIMNNDMFTKLLPVILIGIIGLVFICLKSGKKIEKKYLGKAAVILFVCTGYFLLVTKAAPYQVDRYVMPIYPLVYLLAAGSTYILFSKLIPKKYAVALCITGFGGLSAIHMALSGIPYTYEKNPYNIERRAVVEEYKDSYALYISDNKGCHYYDAVQMLEEYKGYYYVYDLTSVEQTKKDMEILEDENNLIIYVKNTRTIEEAESFVQEVFPGSTLDESNLLDTDEKWNVYLLELKSED